MAGLPAVLSMPLDPPHPARSPSRACRPAPACPRHAATRPRVRPLFGRHTGVCAGLATGADLLIHDSQYSAAEYPRHGGWGHSSLIQTIQYARLCDVNHRNSPLPSSSFQQVLEDFSSFSSFPNGLSSSSSFKLPGSGVVSSFVFLVLPTFWLFFGEKTSNTSKRKILLLLFFIIICSSLARMLC